MKKVLYGFLFFLIGIGYFLLSWASLLLVEFIYIFIVVLDIFLVYLADKIYCKIKMKFKEHYQHKMIFIFILLMPLLAGIVINFLNIYTVFFSKNLKETDDIIGFFIYSIICIKSVIFSSALLVYSIKKEKSANLNSPEELLENQNEE